MSEPIYRTLLVWIFILIFFPSLVRAGILINEVMYDVSGEDNGREWIEIYNSGPESIKVVTGAASTGWRLSDGSQHSMTLAKGDSTLSPGAYAVIVDSVLRFTTDHPNFSGAIFDSSFSLNNISGNVSLLSSKNGLVLDNITYSSNQGADGDGNSLQFQHDNNLWIASEPTPGFKNSSSPIIGNNNGNSGNAELSAHYGSIETSHSSPSATLNLGVGRQRIGAVGSPMEFRVETNLDYTKYNNFIWNFGDGSQGGGSILSHTYKYPGDYVVILNASFLGKGDAISRVNIKIIDPELSISSADNSRIEIKNNSAYEVNLFGRALVFGDKFYAFIKDTIIRPYQSLSFSSDITGLYPQDLNGVYIAVLGDAEQPQFKVKIEEQRLSQINYIKKQLSALQEKMGNLFTQVKSK